MTIRVVTNALSPAQSEEEYRIHCGALEWSLAEPIIINTAEDIKSSVDWRERVQPFAHQVQNLIRFCRRLPVTLLADDVGLGKTISAGLIVSELMKRSKVKKVFVICPKILIEQWIEEMGSKFGIEAFGAVGTDLVHCRKRTEPIVLTTYQSATSFLSTYRGGVFDMLILDEAHKVRNLHGTKSTPKMARAIFSSLEKRLFKYVLMLTATPIQNRLWDIYSLIDCLAVARGHRNPFGDPNQFARKFIADNRNTARRLDSHHAEEFQSITRSYMFRTRRVDAKLAFPDRQVQTYQVTPTDGELKLQRVIGENITDFNGLEQTSLLVALMSSPHALATQLQNMSAKRTAAQDIEEEVSRITKSIERPAKVVTLLQIADDLRKQNKYWRMVVFTTRKETQKMIGHELSKAGISHGFISGSAQLQNQRTIEAFKANPPQIHVIVSTDAGAEGVNLQAANVLVNYDLPWNPMIVEQRIGRIQRIGSAFRNVWVANIVHRDSPEQRIVARLLEKLQVIAHTVGDIEAVLEATDDPDGESLEKQIRDMVIASLRGQDQEMATRLKERSIEEAKKQIEQSKQEMDLTLGDGQQQDEADVPMPRLKPALPSLSFQEIVNRALVAEGFTISEIEPGLFSAWSNSHGEEKFTFDESIVDRFTQPGVFMGRTPMLYQPGKPAFERLVQRWIDRGSSWISDKRHGKNEATQFAKRWLADFEDSELVDVEYVNRDESLHGQLICRTRVSNSVDSYEKLIPVPFSVDKTPSSIALSLNEPIRIKALAPNIEESIRKHVEGDDEVTRFTEYYQKRLENELRSTEAGPRRDRLVSDLSPVISADASAAEANMESAMSIKVRYRLGGDNVYESVVNVEGDVIAQKPPVEECSVSQRFVPKDCLESCSVTGRRAMLDHLVKSEVSGKYALIEHTVQCALSGQRILASDSGVCSFSSQTVDKRNLETSGISGRLAMAEFMTNCEITGIRLIQDELVESSVSKRRFREDQVIELALTGAFAHRSEAVQCQYSSGWYLESDCSKSAVSGQWVSNARVVVSSVSGRKCDTSEAVTCAVTDVTLLPDESGRCAISGKLVSKSLLITCQDSGRQCLESEMLACEETGVLVAKDQIVQCSLTQKYVRRSLTVASPVSGARAIKSKTVVCEESGGNFLPEEVAECEVSKKRCELRLLAHCAVSGKLVLKSLLQECCASGKMVLPEFLVQCPDSKSWGIPEYFVNCEASDTRVAPGELIVCAVTGKNVRRKITAASAASGNRGIISEMRKCQISDRFFLPEEIGVCEYSGKSVDARLLGLCEVSGKRVQKALLKQSDVSGKSVLPNLLARCPDSNKWALEDELCECESSHIKVLPNELVVCAVTQLKVRRSLTLASAASGKRALSTAMMRCEVTEKSLLPDEVATCELTMKSVDCRLLAKCEVTNKTVQISLRRKCCLSGKMVVPSELARCEATGQMALPHLMVRCAESNDLIVPDHAAVCRVTGQMVRKSLLGKSDLSGEFGLKRLLVKCSQTNVWLLPSESGECSLSGLKYDARLLRQCSYSGKIVLESKLMQSKASNKWMLPEYTKMLPNGIVVGRDEVALCVWTKKYQHASKSAMCSLSELVFAKQLMNEQRELRVLRECLDGKREGTDFPDPGYLARNFPKYFSGVTKFKWVSDSNSKMHILFGAKSTFGFNERIFAVVAEGDLNGLRLRGKILWGRREKGKWIGPE